MHVYSTNSNQNINISTVAKSVIKLEHKTNEYFERAKSLSRKEDVSKMRELSKIMKDITKAEQDNNIKLFHQYNEEERQYIKELVAE